MLVSTEYRQAAVAAAVALVNGGTLRLRNSTTTLCDITLETTAFDVSSGVATARGTDGTNPIGSGNPLTGTGGVGAGSGTAIDNYQVLTSGGAVRWSGDADELDLDNYNIANGQTINITSWTHTIPAGA
jgi:hypothetical protein